VQKRLAHLTLQLAPSFPAAAEVSVDNVALEPTSLSSALPLNPGEHVVLVRVAGHDDAKYSVKLGEGDNQALALAPGPVSGSEPAPTTASAPSPSRPPTVLTPALPPAGQPPPTEAPLAHGWWTAPRKAGVVFGSLGLGAIGAGSALVATGDSGGHVDSRAAWGGISIVTGGALFISGLVLLASGPPDEAAQHARMLVTPTLVVAQNATLLGAAGKF
jgi:hypothetical protein